MERIGMALARPKGPTKRQDQYGIYAVLEAYGIKIEDPTLYAKYEGYREQREDGEALVGLPLAGPHAAHSQPLTMFCPHSKDREFGPGEPKSIPTWTKVRYFREGPWSE